MKALAISLCQVPADDGDYLTDRELQSVRRQLTEHLAATSRNAFDPIPISELAPVVDLQQSEEPRLVELQDLLGAEDSYHGNVCYAAFGSVIDLFHPCEADFKDGVAFPEDCAIRAYESLRHSASVADDRMRIAWEVAAKAFDAEDQWQNGTRLDFDFCTTDIRAYLDDLQGPILASQKDEISELAVMALGTHLDGMDR